MSFINISRVYNMLSVNKVREQNSLNLKGLLTDNPEIEVTFLVLSVVVRNDDVVGGVQLQSHGCLSVKGRGMEGSDGGIF